MRPAYYSAGAVLLMTVLCGCEATRSARHSSNKSGDSGLSSPSSGDRDLRPSPGPPPPAPPAVGVSHGKVKSVGFLRYLSGPSNDSAQDECASTGCTGDGWAVGGCADSVYGNGCESSDGHRMRGLFGGLKELFSGCDKPQYTFDSCGDGSCGGGMSPYVRELPVNNEAVRHFNGQIPPVPSSGSYSEESLPDPVPPGPLPVDDGASPLPVPPHSSLQIYEPSTPSASARSWPDRSGFGSSDDRWVMPPQWLGGSNRMWTASHSGGHPPIQIRSTLKASDL